MGRNPPLHDGATAPSEPQPTAEAKPADPSKSMAAVWIPIILSIGGAIGGAGTWLYQQQQAEKKEAARAEQLAAEKATAEKQLADMENARLWREYLVKIEMALEANRLVAKELQADFTEPNWGILESYVIRVRRDGQQRHAQLYGRIARLVQDNAKIVDLLVAYRPYVLNEELPPQITAFKEHAERYNDRWLAIQSVIESKEQLPYATPFPESLTAAVAAESKLRKPRPPPGVNVPAQRDKL